jgi:hypothetical protein
LFLLPPTPRWTHGDFLVCKLDPQLLLAEILGSRSVSVTVDIPPVPPPLAMFRAAPVIPPDPDGHISLPSDYEDDWPELSDEESE